MRLLTRRRVLPPLLLLLPFLAGIAPAQAEIEAVIAASKPSVLAVGTFNALNNPGFRFRGTGFVVDDGTHAVTNAHVLPMTGDADAGDRLIVVLSGSDGRQGRGAKVIASDPVYDLALLKFEGAPLPALKFAPDAAVPDGRAVVLVGYPIGVVFGFVPVSHRGIVAATVPVAQPLPNARLLDQRTVYRMRQGSFDILQLDATAYPGNSGSPLLDADSGLVLGVINSVHVKATRESALSHPTGISYAIPARHASALLQQRR
ncbi:S1C family serine protease [Aquabacterium humicola]|uniref:S1C family serine protease n=1 Tax=Aquabacterium humicola TaxID=3237377 RepID=UPI00254282B4|nr:serine protease [Rubrivivax pictus]